MTEYHVVWRIEVEADSPEGAAIEALSIMQDPESSAQHFDVIPLVEFHPHGDRTAWASIDLAP